MSSKLKPNRSKKKKENTAKSAKIWSIVLCVGALVAAMVLILFKMGVF